MEAACVYGVEPDVGLVSRRRARHGCILDAALDLIKIPFLRR